MYPIMSYVGGATAISWGVAHLVPTRKVVAGFGSISEDNRRIITMEWIAEGVFLVFVGAMVVMAFVSLLTGFKVRFAPFRLCPLVFTVSAALILAGAFG